MTRNRDLSDVAPFVDGVSSNIQTQINAKQGAISVTADRALISDGSGALAVSTVTSTQLATVPNLAPIANPTFTGVVTTPQVNVSAQGSVRMEDAAGGEYAAFQAPTTLTASYIMTMPPNTGNAGQFLQTNGSGVLSFATVASPPTPGSIELTAAEALSAGQTFVINSSGQAKGVEKVVGTVSALSSGQAIGGGNYYFDAIYYPNANATADGISGSGVFGAIIRYDSSNAIYQFRFTVNPNTGDIQSQGDFQIGGATNKGHSLALAYSPTGDRGLFFNADASNGDFYCQGFSYSALTLTSSSELQISADYIPWYNTNGTSNKAALVYDASLNIFVASCDNGTNMLPVYAILLPLGTGAPTLGGSSTVSTSGWDTNYRFPKLATNNQGQFVMLAYDSSGGNTYAVAFTVNPSSSYATTFGSKVQLSNATQSNDTYSIEYDSASGKFITTANSSAGIDVRALTVSSNAITLGTATNLINSQKANHLSSGGDGNLGVIYSLYSSLAHKPLSVAANGNITLGSSVTISTITGWDTNRNLMVASTEGNLTAHSSYVSLGVASNYADTYKTLFKQAISSTSANFVGTVEGAISSGSTGNVTIIGGVNENQTGLTAGLKYYVTSVGGLSTTTTSSYAGVALSSTKLLVKG